MPDSNLTILVRETYEASISNSVGSTLFKSLYAKKIDTGEVLDITKGGEYSCAFFVSSILYLVGLINKQRATVSSLEDYCKKEKRWSEVEKSKARLGDLIFWDKVMYEDGSKHAHVGFALNSTEAVSTSDKEKKVIKHEINYNKRPVTAVYRYNW